MVSEASSEGRRKGELATICHFCFAQTKRNTIGEKMEQPKLILIDDISG